VLQRLKCSMFGAIEEALDDVWITAVLQSQFVELEIMLLARLADAGCQPFEGALLAHFAAAKLASREVDTTEIAVALLTGGVIGDPAGEKTIERKSGQFGCTLVATENFELDRLFGRRFHSSQSQ
jgi:hypothetical protein